MTTISKLDDAYVLRLKRGDDPATVLSDFLDDIGDSDYIENLGHLCTMGGSPDEDRPPEYQVTSATLEGDIARITCSVFFDEKVYGGGCENMPTIEARTGTIVFELDTILGEFEVCTW